MAAQRASRGVLAVRLEIFSGRPDPEWTLEPEAASDLARRLREAISGQQVHAPPEGGLGYRGFRITGGSALGLPSEISVFRRVITDASGKRGRHWLDTAGLERSLLDDARSRGFAELLSAGGAPRGDDTVEAS